jgi:hypothetical protein
MGRFFVGTLFPGQSIRPGISVSTPFNPAGDWGAAYQLAHPRNLDATLVCDFHTKLFSSATGRFVYILTVTNTGPFATAVDIDF